MAAAQLLPWAPYADPALLRGLPPAAALARLQGPSASLAQRTVAVVGLGVSGLAMAALLAHHGAALILVDAREALGPQLRARFPQATLRLGAFTEATLADCRLIALSPGVDPRQPAVAHAVRQGACVFGELALVALRRRPAAYAAITGTNGKSTTTALCGALVQAAGAETFVGGNLGDPLAGWLLQAPAAPRAVLELSSYQIDGSWDFAPDVAAVLNLAPDHLARYGNVATYARSKQRLLAQLPGHGVAVLNADDPQVGAMAAGLVGQALYFGTGAHVPGPGLYAADDAVTVVGQGEVAFDLAPAAASLAHPRLLGQHNRANALAARLTALALLHRAPVATATATATAPASAPASLADRLARGYADFAGLPHRLAPVATRAGVTWINDSKATNDASVATAVQAMAGPYVLLLGGMDDGSTFAALAAALGARPPLAVVTFGAAGARLHAWAQQLGVAAAHNVATLRDACAQAARLAPVGGQVLFSPGCKSFDAFTDYRHRGDTFAAWVQGHAGS